VHMGTSLLATYTGFRRHIDRSEALGANRLLHEGLLSTQQVWGAGILCLALGSVLGLLLVGLRGTPLLIIGLIGVVGGVFYAGWPLYLSSRVIEDAAVFVGLGPLLVLGVFAALTGALHVLPFLVSLPLGFLAESVLYASHLQTFSADVNGKVRTVAVVLGWDRARLLFYGLIGLPYLLVALLILTGALPEWAWLTFLSLLLAGRSILLVGRATTAQSPDLVGLDRQVAQVHLAFGMLLLFSLILG
jgi:1,4-dihydroxy-2-naphthoate polyprenyltransferase